MKILSVLTTSSQNVNRIIHNPTVKRMQKSSSCFFSVTLTSIHRKNCKREIALADDKMRKKKVSLQRCLYILDESRRKIKAQNCMFSELDDSFEEPFVFNRPSLAILN